MPGFDPELLMTGVNPCNFQVYRYSWLAIYEILGIIKAFMKTQYKKESVHTEFELGSGRRSKPGKALDILNLEPAFV
jgi:hypothetical protein